MKKLKGTGSRPRLSVFRSNTRIYAQLINDEKGHTLVAAMDKKQKAEEVGKIIAQKALEKKIKEAIFDRGSNKFHGIVKALAEAARAGGLKI